MIVGATCGSEGLLPQPLLATRFGAGNKEAAFVMCGRARRRARIAGAPATVHATRIESTDVAPAPLVTARALAPLPALLALAAPLLVKGGVCLFLKGANADAELTAAAAGWHMRAERFPSRTAPSASILRISEIAVVEPPV